MLGNTRKLVFLVTRLAVFVTEVNQSVQVYTKKPNYFKLSMLTDMFLGICDNNRNARLNKQINELLSEDEFGTMGSKSLK